MNWRKESESRIQYLTFPPGLNEIVGCDCVRGVSEWVKEVKEGAEYLQDNVGGRSSGAINNSAAVSVVGNQADGGVQADSSLIDVREIEIVAEEAVAGEGFVDSVKAGKVESTTKESELIELNVVVLESTKEEEDNVVILQEAIKIDAIGEVEQAVAEEEEKADSVVKKGDIVDSEDVELKEASPMDMEQDDEDDELNATSQDINVKVSKEPKADKKRKSRATSQKPAAARKSSKRVSIAIEEEDPRPAKKPRRESRTSLRSKVPVTPGCEPIASSGNLITSSGTRSSSRRSICKSPIKVMFTGRVVDDKTRKSIQTLGASIVDNVFSFVNLNVGERCDSFDMRQDCSD
jgi:hypothetical protein